MLGERRGDDVRAVVVAVDPTEVDVRVGLGDRAEGVAEGEADRDDQLVLGGSEGLEVRAAVVGRGGLELLNGDAEVGLGLVGAASGGVVEGAVAASAGVEGNAEEGAVVIAATGGGGQSESRGEGACDEALGLDHLFPP